MNPLKQKQYNLLKEIGCQDLADKVQELVREFNKIEKPKEEVFIGEAEDNICRKLYDADTYFDLKQMFKDYIKKLKS